MLLGIPRADAELVLPALSIPRMERRILGSIYGSARPDRDIPMMLEAYRSGRLPLDSLISHRLTLDEVDTAVSLVRSGEAVRAVLSSPNPCINGVRHHLCTHGLVTEL